MNKANTVKRVKTIYSYLETNKFASFRDICKLLNVSDISVKQDLSFARKLKILKERKFKLYQGSPPASVYFINDFTEELKKEIYLKYNPEFLKRIQAA